MNREQMIEKARDEISGWGVEGFPICGDLAADIGASVVDALLPQVTTVEELEALPVGSILTSGGHTLQCFRSHPDNPLIWYEFTNGSWGGSGLLRSQGLSNHLPLTVVWQP